MFCVYMQWISVLALRSTVRPEVGRPNEGDGVKSQTFIFRRVFALSAVFPFIGKTILYICVCLWVCLHTDI